jgi:hypothetical protein
MRITQEREIDYMHLNQQMQERWLDKVWLHLFGDGSGLVTPGQIRREHLDRAQVRRAELAAIEAAERELAQLRSGQKLVGRGGKTSDLIAVGDVPMYSFIEQPAVDSDEIFARVANPRNLLQSVASDIGHRDLERSLNIRRIGLLAEHEILLSHALPVLADQPLDAQWLQRWRQMAQNVYNADLQQLWARLLVREVARPGRYNLALIELLGNIGERDIVGIGLLARYVFGEFIYDARGRYFQPQLHEPWLHYAAALGLLHPIESHRHVQLRADDDQREPLLLVNHRRALQVSGLTAQGVALPVIRLTTMGKQIFHLLGGQADMAYLLDLAAYLTEQGLHVALGDWQPLRRLFEKKIDYV